MILKYRRYNAYILALTLGALIIYCIFYILKRKNRSTLNMIIVTLLMGIFVLLLVEICFKLDIFNIKTYYYNSFWGADGGIFHNLRYKNIIEAINHLYTDPTSGFVIMSNNLNTSFNMWLEYAMNYGIYVFGFLLIFFCLSIYNFVKMLINPNVDVSIKCVLGMAFLAYNIFYFFESFARSFIHIWLWGLFVNGMIRAYSTLQSN